MKRPGNPFILHGMVGGALAGLVVAMWFLVVDSIAGRPFHTPTVLASALTGQETAAGSFRLVAAYTVVHFAVFACLGVAVAGVITALRTPPRLLFGVLFGLGAQELVFYAGLSLSGASGVAPCLTADSAARAGTFSSASCSTAVARTPAPPNDP